MLIRSTSTLLFTFLGLILMAKMNFAQSGLCDPIVPFYQVNLAGNPNGSWVSSPPIARKGNCCGTTFPDRCIEFGITLDSSAVGIKFDIAQGAVPSGSMYYQIDCGPQIKVGEIICLNGPGPFTLTFCKPGNNLNTYQITSIPAAIVGPDEMVREDCPKYIWASGLDSTTIVWNDITSGNGLYNSLLSCTQGCDSVLVTYDSIAPDSVLYQVCGLPLGESCLNTGLICDTVTVYFQQPPEVSIFPTNPVFCVTDSGILVTATATAGDGNYQYTWYSLNNNTIINDSSSSVFITEAGYYSIKLEDSYSDYCPGDSLVFQVSIDSLVSINAGTDQYLCYSSSSIELNANSNTNVKWYGGNGLYYPNDSSNTISYSPSASEVTAAYVNLYVTTLDQNACNNPIENVNLFLYKPIQTSINESNILCYGDSTLLLTNTSGGMPPYSYLWNTGSLSSSITVTTSGTYFVTVTSSSTDSSCLGSDTITIISPPDFTVDLPALDSIICDSIKDISVNVSPVGNYTYQWSNLDTTSVSSLSPGFYWVNVQDSYGCMKSDSISLFAINSDLLVEIAGNDSICFGDSSLLVAQISGGQKPYTISWNNSLTDTGIYVGGGSYCVTVTDFIGCQYTACFEVKENIPIDLALVGDNLICPNSQTYIYANVQNPNFFTYLWNNGNTNIGMNVSQGFYSVAVTDNWACQSTDSISITNSSVLPPSLTITKPSCYANKDGEICIELADKISNGFFNNIVFLEDTCFQGLSSGQYTIQKTDTNGCFFYDTVSLSQPDPLYLVIDSLQNNLCNADKSGQAWLNAQGGTSPYQFNWSPNSSTSNFSNTLPAGNYTVTVSDSNFCQSSKKFSISEPNPITITSQLTQPSCYGNSNGSISIDASGGTAPFTYFWPGLNQYGQQINNLSAGVYAYQVTDSNNCIFIDSITLSEPDSIHIQILSLIPNKCFGDSAAEIVLDVSGGNGNYSYNWQPSVSSSNNAYNLSSGNYSITVFDMNGCSDSIDVEIIDPELLEVSLVPSQTVSCNDTIQISNTIIGGFSPYQILWSTGDTTQNINYIGAGTYSVTITDVNGCQIVDSVTILSNDSLLASIYGPTIICPGANMNLEVFATGGSSPYNYTWSNNDTSKIITTDSLHITVTVTDNIGCITNATFVVDVDSFSFQLNSDLLACYGDSEFVFIYGFTGISPFQITWNSQLISDTALLPVGNHSVAVMDSLGCVLTKNITVAEASELELQAYAFPVSCPGYNDGYAVVYAQGGTPNYSFYWPGLNDTNQSIYYLSPGFYPIIVSDQNGCTAYDTIQIVENSNYPVTTTNTLDETCKGNDGLASVTINGGMQPYSILWSINDTNATINNLGNGNYLVYVSDNYGCMVKDTAIILPYDSIIVNYSISKPISCYGFSDATISITSAGGKGNLELYLNNNLNTDTVISNLSAGKYVILIKDSIGCILQDSLQINQPDSFYFSSSVIMDSIKCKGDSSGIFSFIAGGGSGSFVYYWNNNEITTPIVSNIIAGSYVYSIVDSLGCVVTDSIIFTDPNPITLSIFNDTLICGNDSVEIKAIASGGKGSFTYNWNPNISSDSVISIKLITDTIIKVEVIDNAGCKSNLASTKISPFFSSQMPAILTNYTICEGDSVFIEIDSSMGYSFINFFYDTILVSQSFGNFVFYPDSIHTLKLITTDICNNTVTDSGNITVHKVPDINLNDSLVGCAPLEIHATNSSGGSALSTYEWTFNGLTYNNSEFITTLNTAGTYYLSLNGSNSYGCTNNIGDSTKIVVYSNPTAGFLLMDSLFYLSSAYVECLDQSIDASIWNWNFGDGSTDSNPNTSHIYKTAGDYFITLIVQNEHECSDTLIKKIEISEDFSVYIPNTFTPNGDGNNDVFNVSGIGITDFVMYIFNRWGEQIFDTHDLNEGWNGIPRNYKNEIISSNKVAQMEVYVYLVVLKDIYGDQHRYIGNVNLVK